MVKGVNKQIIEVNNPDSIYFERAVFYLRPGVRTLPAEISNREISRYIMPPQDYRRCRKSLKFGKLLIYFSIIAVIAVMTVCLTR